MDAVSLGATRARTESGGAQSWGRRLRTKPFLSLLPGGSRIAIITPMRQAHTYRRHDAESGPRARLQVHQNSGTRMSMLRVKPCRCEIVTDEIRDLALEQYSKSGSTFSSSKSVIARSDCRRLGSTLC